MAGTAIRRNQGIARPEPRDRANGSIGGTGCPTACSIRHGTCIPTAGSKEGVYIIATVATPQEKGGGKPIVALPNPFYQAYLGGAVLSGAEPLLVNADADDGFLPDFLSIDEATWRRMAVVYLCSPANPQGAIAGIDYLQKLLRLVPRARRRACRR